MVFEKAVVGRAGADFEADDHLAARSGGFIGGVQVQKRQGTTAVAAAGQVKLIDGANIYATDAH